MEAVAQREESRLRRFLPTAELSNMSKDEWQTLRFPSPMDEFYVSALTESQVTELRAAFDRFDENGDGHMCENPRCR